jgi:hypothetical protein
VGASGKEGFKTEKGDLNWFKGKDSTFSTSMKDMK